MSGTSLKKLNFIGILLQRKKHMDRKSKTIFDLQYHVNQIVL